MRRRPVLLETGSKAQGAINFLPLTERTNCFTIDYEANGPQAVDASFSVRFQARESSDKPILNAFCRVAPSLRFRLLAIFLAGVFLRAADFNSRTSEAVQERRFEFLLAM
jgi:hypothetical protein